MLGVTLKMVSNAGPVIKNPRWPPPQDLKE